MFQIETRRHRLLALGLGLLFIAVGVSLPAALVTRDNGAPGAEALPYLEVDVRGEPLRGIAVSGEGS